MTFYGRGENATGTWHIAGTESAGRHLSACVLTWLREVVDVLPDEARLCGDCRRTKAALAEARHNTTEEASETDPQPNELGDGHMIDRLKERA